MDLPTPTILEAYLDNDSQPPMRAFRLRWDPDAAGMAERTWHLPQHLTLKGPAPERFGLSIVRGGRDTYRVHLLWNHMSLSWARLTRVQILSSALASLLRVLGQDLWQLLNQAQQAEMAQPAKVA
jgi:hypothetical protein